MPRPPSKKRRPIIPTRNLIYTRLKSVNKDHPNLVAQQDLDTAQANDLTTAAAIAAAKANVEKYQTMVGYTQITAPFDGVITHRYADPGTLIEAGTASDTQASRWCASRTITCCGWIFPSRWIT